MIEFDRTLERRKGPGWPDSQNEYGEADGAVDTIEARVEPKFTRVVAQDGTEHQSQAQVFTPADVRVGDVLVIEGRDHIVLVAGSPPDLSGEVWFRQVMC